MERLQLIYGSNTMRITEMAKELAGSFLESPDEFSLVTLNYKETSIEAIIEEAQTLPFLSDQKAVVVNDAFSFTGAKVKSEVNHDIDRLVDYLTNKNDDTLLIFKVFNEQLDNRKKITKIMKQKGKVTEVAEMDEQEVRQYLSSILAENEVAMDKSAMDIFINRTGINYETVTNEMNKLILYAENTITAEDVEAVVSVSLEQNIFKLTDLILSRKKAQAVRLLRELILQKEEPMQLLHLIIGQFRLLYQVKLLLSQGYQADNIAKSLKVHPYRVKLASRDVGKYSQEVLENKMVMCRDIDYKFKSSYLDRETLFELFVLEI
ncbi:DNA polymerase III subunit delta [Salinicoccus halodurans]|uniref:DNA polymerase III subunit delta n=1 Tax=Salinicoccus halodurans TaxID=407035 RepID=A0AA94HCM5_9STAP|nr:DNA polymerase III subunit delta [Salinicoccus halodurans]SFK58306.1 DNA polymerase III, delta subunit [Salinicoccus halodurans]